MFTVTVNRANVTSDEVAAVLSQKLGAQYKVTPSMSARFHRQVGDSASTVLVKRNWLQQADVRIVPVDGAIQLHVSSGSSVTLGGLVINHLGIVRKVQHTLANAAELTMPNPDIDS
jgi:hypothetical protein